ncbi:amino acid synthesis family protein [Peribacillus butanolivorans]
MRKFATFIEEIIEEGGQMADKSNKLVAAMAVIKNPYAGKPFQKDLSEMVNDFAPTLGEILGKKAVEVLGEPVEAYGKGALVGSDGEIEHGSALIHTLKFGNAFRGAAKGSSYLPSAEKRGGVGAPIDIRE